MHPILEVSGDINQSEQHWGRNINGIQNFVCISVYTALTQQPSVTCTFVTLPRLIARHCGGPADLIPNCKNFFAYCMFVTLTESTLQFLESPLTADPMQMIESYA